MKLSKFEHDGVKFLCRQNTSDHKTFVEVIQNKTYQRSDFHIKPKEHWIDLGGNCGAFTVWACSLGATVDVYEPDPYNCKMIERNLKINDYNANIHCKAVVASEQKKALLFIGNNMQVWRNSLIRDWGNQKIKVDCIHFEDVIKSGSNVKMDIEGSELQILEKMEFFPKKMVFEYSFDIDRSILRYKKIIDNLKNRYQYLKFSNSFYLSPHESLPMNVFPPCDTIFCQ